MIKIKEAMARLVPYGAKRQATINSYCINGEIPCKRDGRAWYIDEDFIEKAIGWRKTVVSENQLMPEHPEFNELNPDVQKQVMRQFSLQTMEYLVEQTPHSMLFEGRIFKPEKLETVKKILADTINTYIARSSMVCITEAAKQMEVSVYKLKRMIEERHLRAMRISNVWYIEQDEIDRFIGKRDEYIGLFDIAAEVAAELNTVFEPENGSDRGLLNSWCRANQNIGSYLVPRDETGLHGDRRNSYYVPENAKEKVAEEIRNYLRYKGNGKDKTALLQDDPCWDEHPKTYEALTTYSNRKQANWMAALMEILIVNLDDREIMDYDNESIQKMLIYAAAAPTQIYQAQFAQFVKFVTARYECNFDITVDYKVGKSHAPASSREAYTVQQYYLMSYMAFNDDYIGEHNMINKALNDSNLAFTWMYVVWHYVAMWRTSDITTAIPIISVFDPAELRHNLENNEFSDKDADYLSLLLEESISASGKSPHKTKKELLHVHLPESLRPIVGRVYAICLTHFSKPGHFPERAPKLNDYVKLFGSEYTNVFGREVFSNRRANKSFADAISTHVELSTDKEHKILGYVVAGYARSHVKHKGKMPAITYRYLQYKMDGLSDNEIMMLLWESGTCSFITDMMLEVVYGEEYAALPIDDRNELIVSSGLDALSSERAAQLVHTAHVRGRAAIEKVFSEFSTTDGKEAVREALVAIVEGTAESKDGCGSCLRASVRQSCSLPACTSCIGCDNLLMRKSAVFKAVGAVSDLQKRIRTAASPGEQKKLQMQMDQCYLPATMQLLTICKDRYNMDITPYALQLRDAIIGITKKEDK